MEIADAAATYVSTRIATSTQEGAFDAHETKVPNATTRKAIAELEAGKGKRFKNADGLMADLHEDD